MKRNAVSQTKERKMDEKVMAAINSVHSAHQFTWWLGVPAEPQSSPRTHSKQLCLSSSQQVEEAARNASCSACPSADAAASAQTHSATVLSEIKKVQILQYQKVKLGAYNPLGIASLGVLTRPHKESSLKTYLTSLSQRKERMEGLGQDREEGIADNHSGRALKLYIRLVCMMGVSPLQKSLH